MKFLVLGIRVLLGVGFMVFGLNILHPFLPQPPMPEGTLASQFMAVMVPTHWMKVVGFFQLLGGLLVLIGGTAPIGLALLAPVLVNIIVFHVALMGGEGVASGLVFSVFEVFLIYAYRESFAGLLNFKAQPKV